MSRSAKITYAVTAVLGLVAGIYWGVHAARFYSDLVGEGEVMATSGQLARFSGFQFSYADQDNARKAVSLEIALLSEMHQARPDWEEISSLGLPHVRLGLIDGNAGQKDAERQEFDQAKSWYGRNHSHAELTDDQLKDWVRIIDHRRYGIQ